VLDAGTRITAGQIEEAPAQRVDSRTGGVRGVAPEPFVDAVARPLTLRSPAPVLGDDPRDVPRPHRACQVGADDHGSANIAHRVPC
jgi:hypothetical protein